MHTDIVLDLETLGVNSDAPILSIGAVRFDPYANDVWDSFSYTFYRVLPAQIQLTKYGRKPDASTIQWWLDQSDGAKAVFNHPDVDPTRAINQALEEFADFTTGVKYIWGNGSTFDNTILRSLFAATGQNWPLPYWADADLRTLQRLAKVDKPATNPRMIQHHALDDAKYEALCIQHFFRALQV